MRTQLSPPAQACLAPWDCPPRHGPHSSKLPLELLPEFKRRITSCLSLHGRSVFQPSGYFARRTQATPLAAMAAKTNTDGSGTAGICAVL